MSSKREHACTGKKEICHLWCYPVGDYSVEASLKSRKDPNITGDSLKLIRSTVRHHSLKSSRLL